MLKKRKDFEEDFKKVAISDDLDEIAKFIDKCNAYDMVDLADKTQAIIGDRMKDFVKSSENLLNDANLKEALNSFAASFKLRNLFESLVKENFQRIEEKFIEKLNKIGDDLEGFERFNTYKAFERSFDELNLYLQFKANTNNSNVKCDCVIFKKISERTSSFLVKVIEFVELRQKKFTFSLENFKTAELKSCMDDMKKWTPLLTRINHNEWMTNQYQLDKGNFSFLSKQFIKSILILV